MKKRTIIIPLLLLVVCGAGGYAVHTRTGPDRYDLKGNVLTHDGRTYRLVGAVEDSEREDIGKVIGIAVDGKRTLTDWIWPIWIMEFRHDRAHGHIFVRGLMDVGATYRLEAGASE